MSVNRIQELVEQLNEACHAYYNLNNPIMENREYNQLFDELKSFSTNIFILYILFENLFVLVTPFTWDLILLDK